MLDENELVERARCGDADAYEVLVRHYHDLAFRTAFVITRSATEAEEAVQDAFVKAYYALSRFHAGAAFRPWLLRIVANESRNRRAAAGRRAGLALRAAEQTATGPDDPLPEASAVAAEQRAELLAAVNELRAEDRLVVAYRYFFELSEAEMADALGCARGTVKSRLSRALGRLRARMTGAAGQEAADG
jgi:RNA polymerase sigma-70 factor (ECF subfamily)